MCTTANIQLLRTGPYVFFKVFNQENFIKYNVFDVYQFVFCICNSYKTGLELKRI